MGFGSDGASVNLGSQDGVATLLKNTVPHLIAIHFVANRNELGVLSAIRDDDQLQRLQEVLIHLYKQYHYSPKAMRELCEIATVLDETCLKPVNLEGTRWLPYIHRALKVSLTHCGLVTSWRPIICLTLVQVK